MKFKIILLLVVTILFVMQQNFVEAEILDTKNDEVYIQQLQLKNKLFIESLDKFGAHSKEEVIQIYVEGIKTRSGPLQYSVMCKNLKEDFIKQMEETNNYSWVTGFSSPWVKDYKVIYDKKNKDNSYTVTINFIWETSSGPFNETKTTLTILKNDGIWCITNIKSEYN